MPLQTWYTRQRAINKNTQYVLWQSRFVHASLSSYFVENLGTRYIASWAVVSMLIYICWCLTLSSSSKHWWMSAKNPSLNFTYTKGNKSSSDTPWFVCGGDNILMVNDSFWYWYMVTIKITHLSPSLLCNMIFASVIVITMQPHYLLLMGCIKQTWLVINISYPT